ncbi:hypothetical protein [Frigoribacterium salinisoli]
MHPGPAAHPTIAAASVAVSVLVFGPFVLGSMLATWDRRHSETVRRLFRRWLVGIVATEVASVAVIVAYAVVNGSPAWLPVLATGTSAVLMAVAALVGPALLRHHLAHRSEAPAWLPVTREQIVRGVVVVAVTFGAFLVLGTVVVAGLVRTFLGSFDDLGPGLVLATSLAFFASSVACIVVWLRLSRTLRGTAERDPDLTAKVAKVVLRRKPLELDAHEQVFAARYAHVAGITVPFTLAYVVLLYAGLVLQQVQAPGTDGGFLAPYALALFAVGLVAVVPLSVVRIVRARRYAADHADLLQDAPAGQEAPVTPAAPAGTPGQGAPTAP